MRRGLDIAIAALVLLLTAAPAAADVMPGQPTCEAPPWLECVNATLGKEEIEADACTMKEVKRLGLRFHCGASHNDRLEAYWCRKPKLPPRPRQPLGPETKDGHGEPSEAEQLAYLEKDGAWWAIRQRELGSIEEEMSFGSFTRRYFEEMAERDFGSVRVGDAAPRPRPENPMRFDCFALVDKFHRCGLETERCTPYWEKFRELAGRDFTFVDFEGRDDHARKAIAAVRAADAGTPDAAAPLPEAGAPAPSASATATPRARSSCGCEAARAGGASPIAAALALALAALARRYSARRAAFINR